MNTTDVLTRDPSPIAEVKESPRRKKLRLIWSNLSVRLGAYALALLTLMAIFAPWLYTIDPTAMDPASGNLTPGSSGEFMSLSGEVFNRIFVMGTDSLGRDIWSRIAYGARVSLAVGVFVALLALAIGLTLGMLAGFFRSADGFIMRVLDGVMAIPGILFAITLVALWQPSLSVVIIAIAIPEIPRVARLMRSVVLSIREEPYIEAAIAMDSSPLKIMLKHIMPNAIAPLIVQGTYVCASAILLEAILSFLGIGLPAEIPTWGSIMSEGRIHFTQYPHNVLLPGMFLAVTVLAVNLLGDGLRDTLDPKFSRKR